MTNRSKGLAGVVAGQTAISEVYGQEGRLVYRGYDIHDLAANTTFEEVAYLLWRGDLPSAAQLAALKAQMAAARELPDGVLKAMRLLPPSAAPMDVLRTVVSRLGIEDPHMTPTPDQAIGLTAKIPTILAAFHRLRQGLEPLPARPDLSHTGNYIYLLTGQEPTPVAAESLGTYFILLADHGFNASTFTARIVTSTASDIYSAVSAGIGALKGPLHGGAPSLVLEMLQAIGTPENAEAWMRNRLKQGPIMGIGHRIYRAEDPRAEILRELSRRVADAQFFHLAWESEQTALRLVHENPRASRMYTNVEFYSAATLHAAGLPPDLFTPSFAASRTAGYTAHILEQVAEHELIRPNSEYIGQVGRKVVPLAERG
ncbi:MAG: citrate synthase/methylcitrate synthase [Chloroflexi bacterium]|nr:citrate synthase/methylcitrate synthase [Chloroflexota bacterium]MBI3732583.1 citrate synthase/methylcitrate synthase [Chloroflexota bacterium]